MLPFTLELPDELVQRLQPLEEELPRILELGLRQLNAEAEGGYDGSSQVLEFLAGLPTPEEMIEFHPSAGLQARIQELLAKNRQTGLTPAEEQEWRRYEYLEHLVRMAKARARMRLVAR